MCFIDEMLIKESYELLSSLVFRKHTRTLNKTINFKSFYIHIMYPHIPFFTIHKLSYYNSICNRNQCQKLVLI